ncbi:MAG: hypothetical protein M1820_003904 [Bogoriella megaspora]|nr:MAG: hypothetical protein M1820_003904 [Bogoriella megaspora]
MVGSHASKGADAEDATTSGLGEYLNVDPNAEKRLVRKIDFHVVPMVMLLYLFSFLDRVNIGNARLYGMEDDLNLIDNRYQTAVSLLFVTYILSELPSNLVLKKFRPSRWIAFIATSWGIIATLTGVCQNYAGLIVCRLLLGIFEGGLFPGMTIYLTLFYTKHEIALRVGYLFVSSALAGAFGGLLAYGIGFMDGVAGERGWRWIMIIEGLPTFVIGVASFWLLADGPETAYFLSAEERELSTLRLSQQKGYTKSASEFHWKDVREGLLDWKLWAFCVSQFGSDTMLYGYSTFLPTIIKGLNSKYSSAIVQVLTIPVYALGAIAYVTAARISDWTQQRAIFPISFGIISIVGYAVLMSDVSSGAHYAGCFLVALGLYVCVGIPLAWNPSNLPRYGKRTTATGMQLTIGNCSGIMAPFLYPTNEGPRYVKGHAVTMAMVAVSCLADFVLWAYYKRENAKRAKYVEKAEREQGLTESQVMEKGDNSPYFRYAT